MLPFLNCKQTCSTETLAKVNFLPAYACLSLWFKGCPRDRCSRWKLYPHLLVPQAGVLGRALNAGDKGQTVAWVKSSHIYSCAVS